MKVKPCGYQILVELRSVHQEKEIVRDDGSKVNLIIASATENTREQAGEDTGRIIDFGPQAFMGWEGVTGETADERAKCWGIEKGDMALFSRYDGSAPELVTDSPEYANYRLLSDKCIIGKLENYND